ncbi:MAG: DMT family transporter [Rhizobiales bacterium]|nr:DMT family transporter [Hyphomicrobiales bacterium]NRB13972.1 DMT family transporter [Hyphomicrobiales bacterium]
MNKMTHGWLNGMIGVIIFSGSLVGTRVAVQDLSPIFITSGRATIAALLAIIMLVAFKQKPPEKADFLSLLIVAIGVVVGFPLLTAIALQYISAAHSVIFIGLLPLTTAVFGVFFTKQNPGLAFWLFSLIGALIVSVYAAQQDFSTSLIGNISMAGAIIICGLGYAKGAVLTKKLGGLQVISGALLIALPLMAVIALFNLPDDLNAVSPSAWLGFAYVSTFSMFIGFIFWYKGLAQGGISTVSQLQLLQPFLGLCWAALLLAETINWQMIVTATLVTACVIGTTYFAKK